VTTINVNSETGGDINNN